MKFAVAIIAKFAIGGSEKHDFFDMRLNSMISPASTGPRLRRVAPPALFAFQSRSHA
jgi:hypothetical protein